MQRNKMFSIVTIICFCSIIFIPIGLVTMWFTTEWKKKRKYLLTVLMTVLYVGIFLIIMLFEPSQNTSGMTLPFGSGSQNVQSTSYINSTPDKSKSGKNSNKMSNSEYELEIPADEIKLPSKIQKGNSKFPAKSFYTIMFFLFMLFIIIWQNLKAKKKSGTYENPYVDTKQYKIPLTENSKIPTVHFLKLRLEQNEKLIYATETVQKNEEGDLVVTNKRVVVFGKSEDYEFPLNALTAVSSVTNSVMLLTCGERKYYIFLPENQMKYALATIRWAYGFYANANANR